MIEFNVGEESCEVIGDVDGVVSYYRETDASKVMMIVGFTAKVLRVSVGSCGVIVVWRGKWNFCDHLAISPKMVS